MSTIVDKSFKNELTPTFGILGGIAGHKFVKNLINFGHKVIVWYEKLDNKSFELNGAEIAATPNEVIEKVDITFSFVTDPLAAVEMVFELFLSDVLFVGKGYVQMECLNADASLDIADTINRQNGRYLEVQVLDSNIPSKRGTIIIAAGEQTLFDDCRGCFQALGHKSCFLGTAGNAIKMYLVMQLISGVTQAALVEGMALAKSVGISQIAVQKVMETSNWVSPLLSARTNDIIWTDFAKTNPLLCMQKDLILALDLGDTLGVPLPLTAQIKESNKSIKDKHTRKSIRRMNSNFQQLQF